MANANPPGQPAAPRQHGLQEGLRNSLTCPVCMNILRKPIVMKCGHSMCEFHVPDPTRALRLQCNVCAQQNTIPVDGFKPNQVAVDLLNLGAANVQDPNAALKATIENRIEFIRQTQLKYKYAN